MSLRFEWDSVKAAVNFRKHGVSFDEAMSAFQDPLATIFEDEDHSAVERREILIGHSLAGRLLLVSFIERVEDNVRLISAREATIREKRDYETSH